MIVYSKKTTAQPAPKESEEDRPEHVRNAAALERRRESDTDGTRRRAKQKAEDNRLI